MFLAELAAVLVLATTGFAVDMSNASQQGEEQQVLAAEDDYVAAELHRDEEALRRLVDDRFVLNSSNGKTLDKEALIRSVLGMNMVGQSISERTVLIEGAFAIVFGTTELRLATPDKGEVTSVLRYTSTYVKRQGQWRMLALQMGPRAPGQTSAPRITPN